MAATTLVPSRARWLRILVVALVVMCIAEAGLRARASVLPKPQLWNSPELDFKENQINALASRGGASIISVGSSVIDVAFDAHKLNLDPGTRPGYNAGTAGASIGTIDRWSELLAVPRLHPDTVVIGIVSRELNPNDSKQLSDERNFIASRAARHLDGTENVLAKAEQRLENWSALFRYRTAIRQPKYAENVVGIGHTSVKYKLVNDVGQHIFLLHTSFTNTPAVRGLISRQALFHWTVGVRQRATLARLVAYLHRTVRHVLVVSMPTTDVYVNLSPHGEGDIAEFNRVAQETAEAHGAAFLNLGTWSTDLFADPGHVNAAGSARFMDALQAELHRLGWS